MKNRLNQIKVNYNDQAKYDKESYFKEQKRIYHQQIQLANHIDSVTDSQFGLKPLDIAFIQSTALKDQPKFKQIKKMFHQYNKEVKQWMQQNHISQQQSIAIKGLHLKKYVMISMLKFMRIMLLAPDQNAKLKILDVAHGWFMQNMDPKIKKKNKAQLEKEIKKLIIKQDVLPIDIINRQLIATQLQNQTKDYKAKARTLYEEIDPPNIQLENYNTHKIGLEENQGKKEEIKSKWIDKVRFPPIDLPAYYEESEEEKKQDEPKDDVKNFKTDISTEKIEEQQKKEGQQGEAEKKPQQPEQELDFGVKEEDEGEPEFEEEPEDKKRGKLDPLVKKFMRERQMKKQLEEFQIEKKEQKRLNESQRVERQDNLSANYLKTWAAYRAKIKSQIARKNESVRGFIRMHRNKMPTQEKCVQNSMNKIQLNKTLGEHQKVIQKEEFIRERLNTDGGFSLYDEKRIKTQNSQPFSSILSNYSKQNEQEGTLTQITEIKEKFSKYKIYTPYENLMKGLVQPPEQVSESMTLPPCQLISNPFMKVAKKKKKKKKKH